MNLPKLPFSMIDVDAETKALLDSLDRKWYSDGVFPHSVEYLEAVGIKNGILYILGRAGKLGQMCFEIRKNLSTGEIEDVAFEHYEPGLVSAMTLSLYEYLPGTKKRRKQTKEFWRLRDDIIRINKADIDEKIKNITVYQLSLEEVERSLGIKLQLVDTGKPEKFLDAESEYYLRAEAYKAGADIVVNFQKGSSVGTPVKIVKNK